VGELFCVLVVCYYPKFLLVNFILQLNIMQFAHCRSGYFVIHFCDFVFSGVHETANAKSVIATKEPKKPSCCDHLTTAPAQRWPGRNSGLLRFFYSLTVIARNEAIFAHA
jgi:hypothetical protein